GPAVLRGLRGGRAADPAARGGDRAAAPLRRADPRGRVEREGADARGAAREPRRARGRARDPRRAAARRRGRPAGAGPQGPGGRGGGRVRIRSVTCAFETFALTRPYTIAFRSISGVENGVVRIAAEGGEVGLGAASPEPHVTGETREACR